MNLALLNVASLLRLLINSLYKYNTKITLLSAQCKAKALKINAFLLKYNEYNLLVVFYLKRLKISEF